MRLPYRSVGRVLALVAVACAVHTAQAQPITGTSAVDATPTPTCALPTPGKAYLPCEINLPAARNASGVSKDMSNWMGRYALWTLAPLQDDAQDTWLRLIDKLGGRILDTQDNVAVVPIRTQGAFAAAAQTLAPVQANTAKVEALAGFDVLQARLQPTPNFYFSDQKQSSDLVALTCDEQTPDCQRTVREHGVIEADERANFSVVSGVPGGARTVTWEIQSRQTGGVVTSSFASAGRTTMMSGEMLVIAHARDHELDLRIFQANLVDDLEHDTPAPVSGVEGSSEIGATASVVTDLNGL